MGGHGGSGGSKGSTSHGSSVEIDAPPAAVALETGRPAAPPRSIVRASRRG